MTAAEPARSGERLVLLDALRGFALAGVLLVNLRDLTLHSLLPASAQVALTTAGIDRWIELLMAAFLDGKAFTLFTVLFGVGFALQVERAAARNGTLRLYVRRLLILLVIGALHAYLLWWGDILRLYALLGLLLVPAAGLRPRTLAVLGVIVAVFSTPFLRSAAAAVIPSLTPAEEASAAALAAFQGDSAGAMLRANFEHDVWSRLRAWGLPFYVLGRLLIGAAIGKAGLLRDPQTHRRFWSRSLVFLLPVGIGCTAFVMLRDHGGFGPIEGWWRTEPARILVRIGRSAGSLALGLAYVAIFVLLFQRPGWRRWMERLAPVGRMALTNYLLQTLIAVTLFYGVGFGIGPRFGLVGVLAAAVVIFAAQVALSRWWLGRFQFGPVEWAWRVLTYGRALPIRGPTR